MQYIYIVYCSLFIVCTSLFMVFSPSTLFLLYDLTQRKEEMKPQPEFLMVPVPVYISGSILGGGDSYTPTSPA